MTSLHLHDLGRSHLSNKHDCLPLHCHARTQAHSMRQITLHSQDNSSRVGCNLQVVHFQSLL
jgi:hypothetical protein